jgi:hypothetical protein
MGLENIDLYLKSVQNYALLADKRKDILEYLKAIQINLEKLKTKLYPADILEYEKIEKQNFESNSDKPLELAQQKKISLEEYPNLLKLVELKLKERLINFDLANLEQASIFEELAKSGAGNELKEELAKAAQLKDSKSSLLAYFQKTFDSAKSKGIVLEKFPNLLKYKDYLEDFADELTDQGLFVNEVASN